MNRRTFNLSAFNLTTLGLFAGAPLYLYGCGDARDIISALTGKQDRLDQLAVDFLKATGVPGVALSLLNSQAELVSVKGLRSIERSDSLTDADSFHIGSNAKSMLAMIAARSVELGEIQWDTPILKAWPSLASFSLPAYASVTFEELLAMRAGFPTLLTLPEVVEIVPIFPGSLSQQRLLTTQFLLSQEPVATPKKFFNYSNANYVVAATLLEQLTGKSFETLILERVFQPLGLTASLGWPGLTSAAAPLGHFFQEGKFRALSANDPLSTFPEVFSPGGNVSLNIRQYAKYLRAHLTALSTGPSLGLTSSSYLKLHTQVADNDFGYALGWTTNQKDSKGQQIDQHYGSTDIFGCYALLQPKKNRAVAVMVNGETPNFEGPLSTLANKILSLLD
jgi:D-alanyl-D-alanine carboxypeptidase